MRTCEKWRTVPQGHEYLAAPISLLEEIKRHIWKRCKINVDPPEIAEILLWSLSENAFDIWGPCCKHTFNRVQQLRSSMPAEMLGKFGFSQNDPRKADNFTEINGAILFGNGSYLDAGKLEPLSPSVMQTKATPTIAESVQVQTSSQADSAIGSSSGMNLESWLT